MAKESISLVCMPWQLLTSPSIQLGTLEGVLREEGLPCRSHSLHLAFQDFVWRNAPGGKRAFTIEDYVTVANRRAQVGAGEWVFAVPGVRAASKEKDASYVAFLRACGLDRQLIEKLRLLRGLAPRFLEQCVEELLAAEPTVVGLTLTFLQRNASLALAERLKARRPELRIVVGGTCCADPMGRALLDAFPFVDAVVSGEGERLLAELARCWLEGRPAPTLCGLHMREAGRILDSSGERPERPALDDLPVPVYDEYFERLAGTQLVQELRPEIPFEGSRGCWWGAKSPCTFCGQDEEMMRYRRKSPERVRAELEAQSARYEQLDFFAVDSILDMGYFGTLLPALEQSGFDLRIFYETKANLTREQVRSLRAAGICAIQPGVESLSTPLLRLMSKGVSALQNIRLLKWCRYFGIRVEWNILYGFPGEDPAEYERMAALVPLLVHLPPPRMGPLTVDRYSAYHTRPEEHGIELRGAQAHEKLLYDLDEARLCELATIFEYVYLDGRDPRTYTEPLRREIERWNREAEANVGALYYRLGPGFMTITDARTTVQPAAYTLTGLEMAVYLACEEGATLSSIGRAVEGPVEETELRRVLDELVEARLLYEEQGRYLSLALPPPSRGGALRPTPPDHDGETG